MGIFFPIFRMARPYFFRVSTIAPYHRRTGQRGTKEGELQPLQLQKILKFLGQSADDKGKSTRGENILQGSQGQAT